MAPLQIEPSRSIAPRLRREPAEQRAVLRRGLPADAARDEERVRVVHVRVAA
jgi:hypothetical protein